jgi:hypothetical protein
MAGLRMLTRDLLSLLGQTIKPAPHVRRPGAQPDACSGCAVQLRQGRKAYHAPDSCAPPIRPAALQRIDQGQQRRTIEAQPNHDAAPFGQNLFQRACGADRVGRDADVGERDGVLQLPLPDIERRLGYL